MDECNKAAEEKLPLWTVQPLAVWTRLQEQGHLTVDPTDAYFQENLVYFQDAYDWMRGQMARRLPVYSGNYPWWANFGFMPDLRSIRYQMIPSGSRHVRLRLAVPQSRVLVSAYGAWHCVLNNDYLALTEEEDQAWETELATHGIRPYSLQPLPEPLRSPLIASWERIFDLTALVRSELWSDSSFQATFEVLKIEDVVSVREFVAASSGQKPLTR